MDGNNETGTWLYQSDPVVADTLLYGLSSHSFKQKRTRIQAYLEIIASDWVVSSLPVAVRNMEVAKSGCQHKAVGKKRNQIPVLLV